jgi:hypothetical protein
MERLGSFTTGYESRAGAPSRCACETPANQHKSNGERRDAEDHKQRHGVTTDLLSNAPAAARHRTVIEL